MFSHIQLRINLLWNGLNVCFQLLFDASQVVTVVVGDEVDSNAKVAKTSRTAIYWVYLVGNKKETVQFCASTSRSCAESRS